MLEFREIHKTFQTAQGPQVLFSGLDLSIQKNEFVTMVGNNGAGKSSLFKMIVGDMMPDDGDVLLENQSILSMASHLKKARIGKVYQDPAAGTVGSMTLLENMALADRKGERVSLRFAIEKSARERYGELLKDLGLGLENKLDTPMEELSGGQRQTVALVMATMKTPQLLLLDEHTAALDPKTANLILDKTQALVAEKGIMTIMVTHNLKDALTYGNRLIMMREGQIIEDLKEKARAQFTMEDLLAKFYLPVL
ncbi:ABC transporter ATP-binding protein [Gottschalkiaceae bacterium SANA]|nr:ABC transporter ATP-binding protein [Gottschalkiaceae bacterium SANA]